MDERDVRAECQQELDAIARNKEFWEGHLSSLKEQGVHPTQDQVSWVEKHIEGLEASREWLRSYIEKIEQWQNAQRP